MISESNPQIPFQVTQLIMALKDKKENDHIRGNYRMRLDAIKSEIEKALFEFDVEMGNAKPMSHYSKGKR